MSRGWGWLRARRSCIRGGSAYVNRALRSCAQVGNSQAMSNIRSVDMAASLIDGEHMTVARKSHSTNDGRPNVTLIDGVHFLPARSVTHTDGHVTEIIRSSWPEIQQPLVQVHVTTTLRGRVRGWGLHQRTTDRLFVVSGLIRFVCFDGRTDSPSHGAVNEIYTSDRSSGLLIIPPRVYHGWKNVGETESIIISMPSELYDHEAPDGADLDPFSPATRDIIPYDW
jgi:dTDP-4-dehydrorhamnose 3,5-epimerase